MYCTPAQPPHFIKVTVEHHHVDSGYTIPRLSSWMRNKPYVNSLVLFTQEQRLFFFIAQRTLNVSLDKRTCSFIAFQIDNEDRFFVNWRTLGSLTPYRVMNKYVSLPFFLLQFFLKTSYEYIVFFLAMVDLFPRQYNVKKGWYLTYV